MKTLLYTALLFLSANIGLTFATDYSNTDIILNIKANDSTRLTELNDYWAHLAKTVKDGDFEAYAAAYHEDAVVIFASGNTKVSLPLASALEGWKQGFMNTKAGKQKDQVTFRFSQRIGNETTAHETGIFHFTSHDNDGKILGDYMVHFEMLLIKRGEKWYGVMEYQKSNATLDEWNSLK